jgi:UDP-N-acetylmuramate--alanine ligase
VVLFRKRNYRLHFVGIGGIGMSGIAELLLNLGARVSGSDQKATDITDRLAQLGGEIFIGHTATHVHGADVVVISSAVKPGNPELDEARHLKIPVIRRAEMLAELMRLKFSICIAGSHGKTTTTSLVSTILKEAGLDPTMVIGGKLNAIGSNAQLGQSEYLVAEADESDGSFLVFSPAIAVITNIDEEHMDHYASLDALKGAFVDFARKVPFYGLAVLCLDHPNVQDILPLIDRRVVTYGLSAQADFRADEIDFAARATTFTVYRRGERLGRVTLQLLGEHNVRNALSALAVADELEIPFTVAARALSTFEGVGRRFQTRGEAKGVLVVDDYGHHPVEIEATLAGARHAHKRPIVAVFQPHRYSRTQLCFDGFVKAFNDADTVVVTEIYGAGEQPIEGVTGSRLYEAIRAHGHRDARFVGSLGDIATELAPTLKGSELVITFGAGNVWKAGDDLLAALGADGSHAEGQA